MPVSIPPSNLRMSSAPPAAERAPCILVVDDEVDLQRTLARLLGARGYDVETAGDADAAWAKLAEKEPDVALVDLNLPRTNGMEVLRRIKRERPQIEVIMMTAYGDVEVAVDAVRAGAYDFMMKPFTTPDAVALTVEKAVERKRLVDRTRELEAQLDGQTPMGEIVGTSPKMRDIYRVALGVAPTNSTVLILGENGTGKELIAQAIWRNGTRAERPLRAVNCGAIPDTLVEAELFGSVRGAFTGALDRPGLFELADHATVFLDEIGDLPPLAQAKLLRVLAEGEVKRIGASDPIHVDVRVIAATNVDLRERMAEGKFREDLFYRLSVIPIRLPPLRNRKEDIPLLAYHFLRKCSKRANRDVRRISVEALRLLKEHDWPGNVRELENAMEHAVVMTRSDMILPSDLPFGRGENEPVPVPAPINGAPGWSEFTELPYGDAKDRAMQAFDRGYVDSVMERSGGNMSEAARQAGMDRSNFRRLVKRTKGSVPGEGESS